MMAGEISAAETPGGRTQKATRILIVDPVPEMDQALIAALSERGAVTVTADMARALGSITRGAYGVVFMPAVLVPIDTVGTLTGWHVARDALVVRPSYRGRFVLFGRAEDFETAAMMGGAVPADVRFELTPGEDPDQLRERAHAAVERALQSAAA